MLKRTSENGTAEIHKTYRGCTFTLQKKDAETDWYIIVHGKDGCYRYDGYWRDSADKNWREAYTEAKKGSCLV